MQVEDAAASGGDRIEMASEDDDSRTSSTLKQVGAITHSVQKNVEELQALCKLIDQRHLHSELLSPHMTISNAFELQSRDHQHVGNEEESAANAEGSWLPARVCWRVLGPPRNQHAFLS